MLFIIYIIFLNSFSCFPLNFLKSVSITTVNLKLAFWLLIHFCVFGFPLWPVLNTHSNYITFKIHLSWFCVQNCMRIRMAISFTFMSLIFIALSSCCFETRPHYETSRLEFDMLLKLAMNLMPSCLCVQNVEISGIVNIAGN